MDIELRKHLTMNVKVKKKKAVNTFAKDQSCMSLSYRRKIHSINITRMNQMVQLDFNVFHYKLGNYLPKSEG